MSDQGLRGVDRRYREFAPGRVQVLWDRFVAGENLVAIVGGVIVVAVSVAFSAFASVADPDTWVPFVVAWMLVLISLPICFWLAGSPRDVRLRRMLILGLCLKLLASGPRYYMLEVYYDGQGDAMRYDRAGDYLVQNMAEGRFTIEGSELVNFPWETQFTGYVTGVLYLIFGTSYFGGFLVFSWMAWLGLVFVFRAFQVAFPNAPPHRAALLIFFLPSLLFWPSSIGKDALMVLCVGLMVLGAARLLTGRLRGLGIVQIALASLLMVQVRPHLLLISALALAGSQLAGSSDVVGGRRSILVRLAILLALIPAAASSMGRLDTVLGTTRGEDIVTSLEATVNRTETGGSAFRPIAVRTPLHMPAATVSVLYRPFPFEARNVAVAISAAEGMLLLVLTAGAGRWLWRIIPIVTRNAFGAFCGVYVLAFIVAFSNVANAGILSRQRVQLYAVLMVLVAAAWETHRIHQQELAEPDAVVGGPALASVESPGPLAAKPASRPEPVPTRISVS